MRNYSSNSMEVVIDTNQSYFSSSLREIWNYRELLYFLVWRQVVVKYKQTVVGVLWMIIQPLASIVVMTIVFNKFLKVNSGDIPYPIFALSGLIFWSYFSRALTQSGQSLVSNAHMISKVYFPRIIIPLSSSISPAVDFTISLIILLVLMPFFRITLSFRLLLIPILLIATFLTAISVSLWLSALNVRYRDVGHVIPFLIQIWMYLVPVVYPITEVPETIRPIYNINPMVGVVEGARWALLHQGGTPDYSSMGIGMVTVLVLLVGGFIFFHKMERSFADVI